MTRATVIIFLCLLVSSLYAHTPTHASKKNSSLADPAYSSALAAANRFLHAWQNQDHETGIIMLTDSARQQTSPELLQAFFSPSSEAAYEIARGKRMKSGEYVFPAVLFGASSASRPHYCTIVVIRSGKDDWAVDKLP